MFRHFWSQIAVIQEEREPLTCLNMCGIHIPEGRLIRHLQTSRCNQNTQMGRQRRYVDIAAKCMGATFILMGDNGAAFFEGLDSFKYLEQVLHQTDDDWPAVLRNIRRATQFWGRIGKLMRWEGADLIISAKFYRAVV